MGTIKGTASIKDLEGPQVEIDSRAYMINVLREPTMDESGVYEFWLMGGKEGDKARRINTLRASEKTAIQ